MLKLDLNVKDRPLRVLCLGAHSDDLEIGCAGTLLHWLKTHPRVDITWVVFSAPDAQRAKEARNSAQALLRGAHALHLHLLQFTDGYFPTEFAGLKTSFESLKQTTPDVILTHRLEDRHQDHRTVAELTWQTWRDHLVLEYEIPKYEGDLGQPNLFVPLPAPLARRKLQHLMKHFATQRSKSWFTEDTFMAMLRLRGVECRAPSGLAEAFHARKLIV